MATKPKGEVAAGSGDEKGVKGGEAAPAPAKAVKAAAAKPGAADKVEKILEPDGSPVSGELANDVIESLGLGAFFDKQKGDAETDADPADADPDADPADTDPAENVEGDKDAGPDADPADTDPDAAPVDADPAADALRTELDEAKADLADMKAKLDALTPKSESKPRLENLPGEARLLGADTEGDLDTLEETYSRIAIKCDENPDGWEHQAVEGQEPVAISREQVNKWRAEANQILRRIPQRRVEIERNQAAAERAAEIFPEFRKPSSVESVLLKRILAIAPQLKRLDNLHLIIGDAVRGEQTRRANAVAGKGAAGGKAALPGKPVAAVKKAPPKIPLPPGRAQASAASQATAKQKKIWADAAAGSKGGFEDLVESMLDSQRTARHWG